jgi:hypothetical protein
MVAFETLLLGIVTGIWPVRLMVAPPVATVELRLDAATIGVLRGAPWTMECDFGPGPMPHELTAIGRDASGREVTRATQWANLGGERAKLSALLERDATTHQPVAVRLAWETTEMVQPQTVTATLDGAALTVTDPHRIPLPKVDLDQPHVVSVEAVFSPQMRDRADLAFGGDVVDRAESELTAVAVVLPPNRKSLELADVQGVFSEGGRPLTAIGVDEGHAEVAIVADIGAAAVIAAHHKDWDSRSGGGWTGSFATPFTPAEKPLTRETTGVAADRFYLVDPIPSTIVASGRDRTFFSTSSPIRLARLAHYPLSAWLGVTVRSKVQAIADAVAVAASDVAASNSRRALVLVLAEAPATPGARPAVADVSTYDVAAVKLYLRALNVPLVVWSLTGSNPGPSTAAWGAAVAVRDRWDGQTQAKKLEKTLAAQRIVWLAGRHLPQRITLDESKTALRLAR